MTQLKRYWVSWIQNTADFRPLTDPPGANVLGWWKSGEYIDVAKAILCAVVEAKNEDDAVKIIRSNWEENDGEVGDFRFCEEKPPNWRPGNRFPITDDWTQERFKETEKTI